MPEPTHDNRFISRQRGPLGRVHQWVCSCGAASPEAVDKYVAVLARRAHLLDVGAEVGA